jgi:hypothetical protein
VLLVVDLDAIVGPGVRHARYYDDTADVTRQTSDAEQEHEQDDQGHGRAQRPRDDVCHLVTSRCDPGGGLQRGGHPPGAVAALDGTASVQYFRSHLQ